MYQDLRIRIVNPRTDLEMAAKISSLLTECSNDFKETKGGHVPDIIVDEIIHRLYTSLESVRNTFVDTGYRFVMTDKNDELYGTILIAKSPNYILVQNSKNINLKLERNSAFAPANHHHAFNLAFKRNFRGQGIAKAFIAQIIDNYNSYFSGEGLWLRAEPPMHNTILKLGFIHKPQYDQFFEEGLNLPQNVTSVWEFNKKYICSCPTSVQNMDLFRKRKYKYGLFTYSF
jgi:hypothetical protein